MSTTVDHASHATVSLRTYLLVFAALMVLLVLTVVAAFLPIPHHGAGALVGLTLALLIATAKMVLVILWFMHVIHSSRLTKVFVTASFVWFGILVVLLYSDYLTRGWMTHSRGWNENPAMVRDRQPVAGHDAATASPPAPAGH